LGSDIVAELNDPRGKQMSAHIVAHPAVGGFGVSRATQRRLDDLTLQLKGLVHVRALLETRGASAAELAAHSDAIHRVRDELARVAKADAVARGG
jgi:hypothetical protein